VLLWVRRQTSIASSSSSSRSSSMSEGSRWLDAPSTLRAYAVVWQLKRFVGGFESCGRGRLAVRSGSSGECGDPSSPFHLMLDDDDYCVDARRYVRLWAPTIGSASTVDVRVWELFLCLGGQEDGLDSLATAMRLTPSVWDLHVAAVAVAMQRLAPTLFSSEDFDGLSGPCRASLRTLTSFEFVLWMSTYYNLRRGAAELPRGRRGEHATVQWLGAAVGHLRYAVHRVVLGWNAVARSVCAVDVEALCHPYLLWSAADSQYTALSRPLDSATRFAPPHVVAVELDHGCGASSANLLFISGTDDAVRDRRPFADAQVRAVAAMFLEHLHQCTRPRSIDELVEGHCGVGVQCASLWLRIVRGRLSIGQYRRPLWRLATGAVPPIVRAVVAGLTALPSISTAGRGSGATGAALLDSSLDDDVAGSSLAALSSSTQIT